jgi:hypothetical protein
MKMKVTSNTSRDKRSIVGIRNVRHEFSILLGQPNEREIRPSFNRRFAFTGAGGTLRRCGAVYCKCGSVLLMRACSLNIMRWQPGPEWYVADMGDMKQSSNGSTAELRSMAGRASRASIIA